MTARSNLVSLAMGLGFGPVALAMMINAEPGRGGDFPDDREVTCSQCDHAQWFAVAESGGHGLDEFLRRISELQTANSGLLSRLWRGGLSAEQREEMRGVLSDLLGQAQAAGTVRPEITVGDISVLLWSLQQVITMTATIAPNAWRRHLDILLAGIAPGHRDITHQPMTMQEVTAALALDGT